MKIKVIYNPAAGNKKSLLKGNRLEELHKLFWQYQLPADFAVTKAAGDATRLTRLALKQGYTTVIAAGGDGTASEVAAALVNTEVVMGALPLGTFMNIAQMLAIPLELEKAVMLLKIGKIRKIDVGRVSIVSGEKPKTPVYFLENSGIGMEAELQRTVSLWEKGDLRQLSALARTILGLRSKNFVIQIDQRQIKTRAVLAEVSNGPWMGAGLNVAPEARLNDHRLTVSLFETQKWKFMMPKIERFQGHEVSIKSFPPSPVHIDATKFGFTPVTFSLLPSALKVVTGFAKPHDKTSLRPRSDLDDVFPAEKE